MSDIQEEQKRLYKRAKENDKKILEKELEELRDIFNYEKDLRIKSEKEINRLNNIIDEFDKWLIGEKMMFYKSDDGERLIRFGEAKNKWLELKGDNK